MKLLGFGNLLLTLGCSSGVTGPGAGYIQRIYAFEPKAPALYGHADRDAKLAGPPQGGGRMQGSLDVVSLGCGGSITLEFSNPMIADGPGPDLLIFENAFFSGGSNTFAEPAEVSVSIDGRTWKTFPCDPAKTPWPLGSCAGVQPVLPLPTPLSEPFDPLSLGGDAFDLADLGLPYARFVKITDKSHEYPASATWCQSQNAGFDLDAVAIRWAFWP